MAHIRRKFNDALEGKEKGAAQIMRLIALLYQVEENLRQQRAGPALRDAVRASQAEPILNRLKEIIQTFKPRHFPQNRMGQAIDYALGQWSGLDAYLNDGRVELDTGHVVSDQNLNAIRPTKLGQKNLLFLGSERGGELAAVAFTIIENCKRNGLNLREYLASTMKAIIEQGPAAAPSLTPQALTTLCAKTAHKAAA